MKRIRFISVLMACLLFSGYAHAVSAYIDGKTANRVHLRSAPSQTADSMGLFYTGTEVELLQSSLQNEWTQVRLGALQGYINSAYLNQSSVVSQMPVAEVTGGRLNLRAKPGRESKVLQTLQNNTALTVLGHTADDWYYIKTTNGDTGYVMREYVKLTDEIARQVSAIVQVGETFDGYAIYSWEAPNGQMLYFSGLEDPSVKFEDVNFDGHEDVVVTIIRGASNFFTEFFVWNRGRYAYAGHDGIDYGICNYHLYPEYGIVHSDANNGYAGALHEDVLFRWEGTELKAIRRAVSDTHTETNDFPDRTGYSTDHYLQQLRVRVWDYSKGIYEGELIYDALVDLQEINDNESYSRLFAGENEALWQGIK